MSLKNVKTKEEKRQQKIKTTNYLGRSKTDFMNRITSD